VLLAGCAPKGNVEVRSLRGSELAALVQASAGKTVLVNIWATWCGRCVSEMPALRKLQQEQPADKFELLLVSVDDPDDKGRVSNFLGKRGFPAPGYIKGGSDKEFFEALDPRWTGAIPTSLLYNSKGKLVDFWEGSRSHEDFTAALKKAMEENT